MGLRDLLLLAVLAVATLMALGRPWVGVLAWNWLSFMNPHRLSWSLSTLPVAQIVGLATLFGLLLTKERRPPPMRAETVLMVIMAIMFCISTFFAWERGPALEYLDRALKIFLFTFVTIILIYTLPKIRLLYLVTVASIGFFGFKGGLFSLATAGNYRIWGPPNSFIADNNAIGLAVTMILPMALFAARAEHNKWVRIGLYSIFWLSIPAIIFTYSRGAFLAIAAIGVVLLMQYRKAIVPLAMAGVLAIAGAATVMPEEWVDRQETTLNYETDGSAMKRLQAWGVAFNIALENPILGAGFNFYYSGDERWLSYAPFVEPWANHARAAHSIYFQVLGEHGFLGLGLFLSLLIITYLRLGRLYKRCQDEDTRRIGLYARGAQLALIPYAVAGAFLSLAYFDLFYACVALSVILDREWRDRTQVTTAKNSNGAAAPYAAI